MMSRQTYFYGVAYHLTGDPALLALARDGWTTCGARARPGDGERRHLLEGRAAGRPPLLERTSQDLAYAQLGLAMYYYLTRDPEVLARHRAAQAAHPRALLGPGLGHAALGGAGSQERDARRSWWPSSTR